MAMTIRSDVVTLMLAVFAVYRIATDLAWEDGPFDSYAKVRGRVMTRYGADDWRSNGIACPICISFWLSLPAAFIWGPLYWLAIAGAVAFLVRIRS